jgi:hypothetical protein
VDACWVPTAPPLTANNGRPAKGAIFGHFLAPFDDRLMGELLAALTLREFQKVKNCREMHMSPIEEQNESIKVIFF